MHVRRTLLFLLAAACLVAGAAPAHAATDDVSGSRRGTNARGSSSSGDSLAGQVTSVFSAGRTTLDATNRSDHMDTLSGDASGVNGSSKSAWTGNAIGGQIIAIVTSAHGSSDVVLANSSLDSDAQTGDATLRDFISPRDAERSRARFGARIADATSRTRDFLSAHRTIAAVTTGDAIVGQVVGITSRGRTRVDGTNLSQFDDVLTGDAFGRHSGHVSAMSGTGIAGQVLAIVTASGGSVDFVGADTSVFADVVTGDANTENNISTKTGRVDQPETII